ncbi:MAG: enoyl-CoA hydratase/isomerase family protein, partial [Syntrophales bacterium]|nr:enoyl-CoA hydratase/isomerase family protein [Syntrophales bacterium]
MKNDFVFVKIEDDIAIITINRPPVNALSSETYGELFESFYEISKKDEVKVVVLTGHGEKAFVAGADIGEFVNLNGTTGPLYTRRNNSIREYIRQYNKPVICAINGLAYGGGCALALVCDIKIA